MKDKVTSLDEYGVFIEKLHSAVKERKERKIAIVYGDIKYFKYFNDTYGYDRGDALLARVADMTVGESDGFVGASRVVSDNIVGAYYYEDVTSEELYASLSITTADIERQLREEFNCNRIRLAVGVYLIDEKNADINPETAVSNANLARKKAKEAGSVSVVFFKEEMAERLNRELEIISSVDKAIEDHEFIAYYQPKIDSNTGKLCGAEALIRWKKKDGKFVFPDQFIPAIEKSRQIIEVDYYMYREVFRFIRECIDEGKEIVPISLNVSRQHMKHLEIVDYIEKLLDEYDVPRELLEFEITETVCMEDVTNATKFIDALHRMGIIVSMDDFGSGFSSLNLLSEIPLDVIKLDRCFLHSNELSDKEKVIITSIVAMVKNLDMISLCEGVETRNQSEFLKEVGCDIQQGYFFSRPIPEEEFVAMLKNA